MGTGGVVHTSRGSRLLSEYNCCFHFHEKLLALELGVRQRREIENQTLLSGQTQTIANIVHQEFCLTANCKLR